MPSPRALGRYMKPFIPKNVDVIVKNVVGAGGITGTVAMYRAKPDGYTIGHIYADGMLGTQMIRSNVGYDIDKFTWLAVVSSQEAEALLVRKQSPLPHRRGPAESQAGDLGGWRASASRAGSTRFWPPTS